VIFLMGARSRLFVVLERTQPGAAGRRRIGTTSVRLVEAEVEDSLGILAWDLGGLHGFS
jgi:hypothetical protein